jgi:RNA polymerase-binding transcription factor
MGDRKPRFDASYLDHKRQQLTKLRDELRRTANAAEAVESEIKLEAGSAPREYEDDAQRLDMLETEGHLVAHDVQRLARVERALAKITDGTYGFSDLSGQRIPDDRLEIMPDAILTITEQEANERTG